MHDNVVLSISQHKQIVQRWSCLVSLPQNMNNFVLIKEQMRHCNCFCLSVFAEHSLFVRAFRLKMEPHSISVDEDLYNAAKEVQV